MKFMSKVKLKLSFFETKKVLTYNTFKKATWDVFFVTSIFWNASNENQAKLYLEELVANGDLNDYFLVIFNKVKNMNDEVINRILNSSLYPIEEVNRDYSIKYYPNLNLSTLENCGNLIKVLNINYNEEQEMRKVLRDDETFVSIIDDEKKESIISNTYEIGVENNQIFIKVSDDWYEIKQDDFKTVVENKCENINAFLGLIKTSPEGNNWRVLDTSSLNSFLDRFGFYHQKNWYMFETDCWQELIIAKIFENVYFYQLNRIMFFENQELVEKTLEYLVENQKYDEVKTKTLLALFSQTNNVDLVQKIINDLLRKKDSKEISRYALKLLMQGVTTNWSERTLEKMKNHSDSSHHQELYKINPNLFEFQYDWDSILKFPEDVLTKEHIKAVMEYNQDKKKIRDAIDNLVGKMTTSGVRENLKKLVINKNNGIVIRKVKKKLNKDVGHNEKKYDEMPLETLKKEQQKLSAFYLGDFMQVKKMIDKNK